MKLTRASPGDGEERRPPEKLGSRQEVRDDVKEWKSREKVKEDVVKQPTIDEPEKKWKPPTPSWAGAKKVPTMRLAIEVEAEEIRWAIHTMAGFGYTKVIVQTDSMLLKKMLNGEEEIWPKLKPIIQEI
ncbi:hypothetical protein F2Q70_00010603 [Brassica cretica]|uniref:RNase H type-1 domain-containing protein n=1 Tax=Brassica cretica TaxID=69181 RepID=A0A8S9LRN5_BRACR|nr:hypothetical protein F2Q70_00010603 [Brassica cretica]